MYRVVFVNHTKVYELYAKAIYQSDMYGFIEVEDFIFGDKGQVIVDPGEEKLRAEFAGVQRTYIPMHNVMRIDEVEKEGSAKIREIKPGEKVTNFPLGGSNNQPVQPGGSEE